jgi:hypothetical protein
MVEEIKKSIQDNLSDKMASPFYGSFIISWLLWNWKIWYITFFVSPELLLEKYGMLKIDYIINIYNISWGSIAHLFLFPLLSSFIIIFIWPFITGLYYKVWLYFEYKNKIVKLTKEKEIFEIKEKKLDSEINILEKTQKIKLEKSDEEIWNEDYNFFKESKYFKSFGQIRDSIYKYNGYTDWNGFKLSIELKAFADTNGLINIKRNSSNREIIVLTDKGKFFLKKYGEENLI